MDHTPPVRSAERWDCSSLAPLRSERGRQRSLRTEIVAVGQHGICRGPIGAGTQVGGNGDDLADGAAWTALSSLAAFSSIKLPTITLPVLVQNRRPQ